MGRSAHTLESSGVISSEERGAASRRHIDAPQRIFAEALSLLRKDILAELRTRVAICAVGVFAFSALLLIGLATASLKDVQTVSSLSGIARPAWDASSKMSLLWVLLCFAAFAGLAHTFVHEEEGGTVTALRMCAAPESVYFGKFAFNLLLLSGVAACVTPVYILMTQMPTGPIGMFILLMASGCFGLAGTATIIGALAAKAGGSGALFGAIGLPLLVVFLMLLMNASSTLFTVDAAPIRYVRDIGGLLSYGVLIAAVSVLTFQFVWED